MRLGLGQPNLADMRIITGGVPTLSLLPTDGNGEPYDPGTMTLTVTNADGTPVVVDAVTDGAGAALRSSLPLPPQTALNVLTAVWTGEDGSTFTQKVEVCGAFFFSIAELQAFDPVLDDDDKYPFDALDAVRREVEDDFEQICGVAFVPRYRRAVVDNALDRAVLRLPDMRVRRLLSVTFQTGTTGTTTLTDDELANLTVDSEGVVKPRYLPPWSWTPPWLWTYARNNITVEYEHGYDRLPQSLKRHAMLYARHKLHRATTDIPDRAERYVPDGGGTFVLSMPTAERTGLPDVDAALQRFVNTEGLSASGVA